MPQLCHYGAVVSIYLKSAKKSLSPKYDYSPLKELIPIVEYPAFETYIPYRKETLMSEMKSAYELAMERMSGESKTVTNEQKKALAEIDSKMKAQIAEAEIMFDQQRSTEADPARASFLQQTKQEQIIKIRADAETHKNNIRNG